MTLHSMDKLLEHIKDVQLDVIDLSNESLMKMSSFMEINNLEIDENISTALQYQDIVTQQLTASIETIESVKETIELFADTDELEEKLALILEDAKDKKSRFSGKHAPEHAEDEIEFF